MEYIMFFYAKNTSIVVKYYNVTAWYNKQNMKYCIYFIEILSILKKVDIIILNSFMFDTI